MLIDTHAHLNFRAFKDDWKKVIKRSLAEDIWIINVGTNYLTSQRAIEIAENYSDKVYATIGLHPLHLETGLVKIKEDPEEIEIKTKEEKFEVLKYKALSQSPKVIAIGEIGLDFWYRPKTKRKLELFKEKQKEILIKQLDLARELHLPVIFHCRQAHNDLIKILELQVSSYKFQGVIHCFTGNWPEAQKYLEMGFYLGFNGLIFKMNYEEIIKKTPLEKILLETDCPYLTPPLPAEAGRGGGATRNEPLYLKYIAEKIAEIKNLNFEEIEKITTQNAKNLFKLNNNLAI